MAHNRKRPPWGDRLLGGNPVPSDYDGCPDDVIDVRMERLRAHYGASDWYELAVILGAQLDVALTVEQEPPELMGDAREFVELVMDLRDAGLSWKAIAREFRDTEGALKMRFRRALDTGEVARSYAAQWESSTKWQVEQMAVERFLSDMPAGTWVLDAPCGMGRFFPFYSKRGFIVRGHDSAGMLAWAVDRIADPYAMMGDHAQVQVTEGDARAVKRGDKVVDVGVTVRSIRWLLEAHGPEGVAAMLKEMQRIARQRIVLTARVGNPPFACTADIITGALDGWKMARDEAIGDDDSYRVVELRPA